MPTITAWRFATAALAAICMTSCRTARQATTIDRTSTSLATEAHSMSHHSDTLRDTVSITKVVISDTSKLNKIIKYTIIRTQTRSGRADSTAASSERDAALRRQMKTDKDNDNKHNFFLYGSLIIYGLLIIILTRLGRPRG